MLASKNVNFPMSTLRVVGNCFPTLLSLWRTVVYIGIVTQQPLWLKLDVLAAAKPQLPINCE